MSKKSRNKRQKINLDFDDDFDDLYDDDFDFDRLSQNRKSPEWEGFENSYDSQGEVDARRKIERRRDMKRLYSELDEWEEFGSKSDW